MTSKRNLTMFLSGIWENNFLAIKCQHTASSKRCQNLTSANIQKRSGFHHDHNNVMHKIHQQYIQSIPSQEKNVGKKIGSSVYLSREALCNDLEQTIVSLCSEFSIAEETVNVVRIDKSTVTISLLVYEDLYAVPFPSLLTSHTVHFVQQKYTRRTYGKSGNHPILHRKELLLPRSCPQYTMFAELTKQAEQYGLFEQTNKIGYRKYWLALIESKGLQLIDHRFVLTPQD